MSQREQRHCKRLNSVWCQIRTPSLGVLSFKWKLEISECWEKKLFLLILLPPLLTFLILLLEWKRLNLHQVFFISDNPYKYFLQFVLPVTDGTLMKSWTHNVFTQHIIFQQHTQMVTQVEFIWRWSHACKLNVTELPSLQAVSSKQGLFGARREVTDESIQHCGSRWLSASKDTSGTLFST